MILHHDKQHQLVGGLPTSSSEWPTRAACRTADPALFDPPERSEDGTIEKPEDLAERLATALSYCDLCPVFTECRDDAVRHHTEGFRAGQMRRSGFTRRDWTKKALCGTESGYARHRRLHEPVDGRCRDARRLAEAERRARRRAA